MNTHDMSEALIDLGAASVETQGSPEQLNDIGFAGVPKGMSNED